MKHIHNYGIVAKGTDEDRVILWGRGFAALEIDFSDNPERPVISLVHDDGMSQTLSIDFKDAAETTPEDYRLTGSVQHKNAASGWQYEAQEEPCFAIRLVNPSRKQTVFIQSDAGGILFQMDHHDKDRALAMGITTGSLISMNLWPAMPVAGLTNLEGSDKEKVA